MMYSVDLTDAARRDLAVLDADLRRRVALAFSELALNPRPHGSIKLQGEAGAYRMRVGTYRIKYHVDDLAGRVIVVKIQHRREVYR